MKFLDEAVELNTLGADIGVVINSLGGEDGDHAGECHILGLVICQIKDIAGSIMKEPADRSRSAIAPDIKDCTASRSSTFH